jgi:hypothetical protein
MKFLLQFFIGQIGRPSKRRYSLGLLLTPAEVLEPGWEQVKERSWRMGMGRRFGKISSRARRSGSFTAIRMYKNGIADCRMWIQVSPYASTADAHTMVTQDISLEGHRNPNIQRLSKQVIDDIEVPSLEDVSTWELHTARDGRTGYQRIVAGRVDSVVIEAACSGPDSGWPWADVVAVATAQATKIRECLAGDPR